jgi:hypothetical protein
MTAEMLAAGRRLYAGKLVLPLSPNDSETGCAIKTNLFHVVCWRWTGPWLWVHSLEFKFVVQRHNVPVPLSVVVDVSKHFVELD